jgi:hypothetical protein
MNTAASTPNERVKIKKAFEMVIGLVSAYDLRCLVRSVLQLQPCGADSRTLLHAPRIKAPLLRPGAKVEIRGLDIFDPTTGEVRSSGDKELMNDVAAWFADRVLYLYHNMVQINYVVK